VNPSNETLMETCGNALGPSFKYQDLKSCATSNTGNDLLLENAKNFEFKYGLQGLPVVEVNGKVVSTFFSCHVSISKVMSSICSNLEEPKPKACNSTAMLSSSSNCDASSMVKRHEGVRKCVYVDTTGHHTIGVGFNLDASGARSACEAAGIDYDAVYSGSKCLDDAQVNSLFSLSMKQAESAARADVSSYDSLCCNVQNVVTDMAFNLGQVRLSLSLSLSPHTHTRTLVPGWPGKFFEHDSIYQPR
jgi:GH24 family phage-related lysozyme (muramidase)